ncbi:MAG TPA: serine hydrolase domain-containing protein [Solirubrobacteraceae bacterium]|nr:serine hydrolase domain-containing protein [Solirubrobacteraceae bacterium]
MAGDGRLAGQLDEVLSDAVTRGIAAGLAAVVVDRDGELYLGTAGSVVAGEDRPVTAETVFRIASMTKPLVTVAALQLVEAGRLDLDDEVASIVPAFAELRVLDGFDGDQPVLRPAGSAATIRNLLTHTSGCGYWFGNADLARYQELTGLPDIIESRLGALEAPLMSDPGTRWEYGISIDWLGQVIETVTGQDLGAYLDEHLLGPLGMADTTFSPTPEARERLMTLHERPEGGGLVVSEREWVETPEFSAGGHGLYSTARDYGRFLRAMLRGGELDGARVLSAESVDLAFSDQLNGLPLPDLIPTQAPWLVHDVVALPFRQTWGFGFQLMLEDIPGMRREGSGFWSGVLNTHFWIDRASGVAGAVLTQLIPMFDEALLEVLAGFEMGVYAGD